MGLAQPTLFAEEDMAPKRYVPNPQYVRNRLQSTLDEMRAAAQWPWDVTVVSLRCDSVLPRLYELLPDKEEAQSPSAPQTRVPMGAPQ